MANECIFCGKPAGSREHIWPQWVLARKDFGPFRLKRAGVPDVILNGTELTTKRVCKACNSGWMSDLEGKVKPILEPMFDGRTFALDLEQQRLIAVWVAKMAFLWDSTKGRNADNAFFSKSEGVALAKHYKIPDLTSIWLGRIDEPHRVADGYDFTLDFPPNRVGGGSCVTLLNESFVAQMLSFRFKEIPSGLAGFNLPVKGGDWNNLLVQIEPQSAPVIHWPPPGTFSPLGYSELMDRWRTGTKVDKIIHS